MEGDAKSRQLVRRLHLANPGARIVVMGCYATRDPQTVARLPGVTQVITDKTRLAEELHAFGVTAMPAGITRFDGHQRAFVKVQDGCLLNCTYCIIPHVRPTLRSRAMEAIAAEVLTLVAGGCREIVLTGVHLGHYGLDLSRGRPKSEWCRLWHLLERLDALPGDFRIRLSSLEAAEARDDLVRAMSRLPRVVPHLHLCLQSGSDRVLRRMRRRYTAAGFLERCRRLREALDRPALTTDVIVGFPGETDADFDETCRVLRTGGFSRVHVFSYSPRGNASRGSRASRRSRGGRSTPGNDQAVGIGTGSRLLSRVGRPHIGCPNRRRRPTAGGARARHGLPLRARVAPGDCRRVDGKARCGTGCAGGKRLHPCRTRTGHRHRRSAFPGRRFAVGLERPTYDGVALAANCPPPDEVTGARVKDIGER